MPSKGYTVVSNYSLYFAILQSANYYG